MESLFLPTIIFALYFTLGGLYVNLMWDEFFSGLFRLDLMVSEAVDERVRELERKTRAAYCVSYVDSLTTAQSGVFLVLQVVFWVPVLAFRAVNIRWHAEW
jgi:hypothetical protein